MRKQREHPCCYCYCSECEIEVLRSDVLCCYLRVQNKQKRLRAYVLRCEQVFLDYNIRRDFWSGTNADYG